MPDFRGLFLRGYGAQSHAQNNGSTIGVTATLHESGALGVVQGDAIRNISGSGYVTNPGANYFSGAFEGDWVSYSFDGGTWYGWGPISFNSSRIVPTANENRPANMAVRHLIRAKN